MDNIFLEYPEFINSDPRKNRVVNSKTGSRYNINAEFQYHRHRISLPKELIQDKHVLDLGCCVAATGAWALYNGARKYTGVDIQSDFCQKSRENLSLYFPDNAWEIVESTLDDFFKNNQEHFDVVVAFGIIYQGVFFENTVKKIASVGAQAIIVDSICTTSVKRILANHGITTQAIFDDIKKLPAIEYRNLAMVYEAENTSMMVDCAIPNAPALEHLLAPFGYRLTRDHSQDLISLFPKNYPDRYCVEFAHSDEPVIPYDFGKSYTSPTNNALVDINHGVDSKSWVFDSKVAETFDDYVRRHIPDYDKVIDLSIKICQKVFPDHTNTRVIDIGCAVGETIKRFYGYGFRNLVGVDSSPDMLDKIKHIGIAECICDTDFPSNIGPYHAVICNWTLHFIKEKKSYLEKIYQGLFPEGILILTDKMYNSGLDLDLYHDFKRANGVSEEEILIKSKSLRGVMFVDPPDWYAQTLREIGFQVSIVHASPCFMTFLCRKL